MCHMRAPKQEPPLAASFRRRFPLELTAEECELLDRAALAHGTKRAALLAGLAALDEADARKRGQTVVEAERDQLRAERDALAEKLAALERELGEASKDAGAEKKRAKASEQREQSTRARDAARIKALEAALRSEQETRREAEADLEELGAELVDWIHCGRCSEWVGREEWEFRPEGEDEVVYHSPCGYHRGGLLDPSSVLALRRPR